MKIERKDKNNEERKKSLSILYQLKNFIIYSLYQEWKDSWMDM